MRGGDEFVKIASYHLTVWQNLRFWFLKIIGISK